ncbi:glutathione-disulfide reductase [Oleiagrimonas soli]|uniref:Glutathione reductase n=1 Tax=Oleiagrimonas soli TaxID=1543381 RepID=A0A099CVI7_9GAMM|nr:glutathione-disulfide reductase [Oleiagrimonas soli]KGI77627.1 glutathione reductase [Oleiagrimonas soli]MBB6182874.1 glutathione reductase (NADPH) [Oleiagrimonas soli]
MRTFDYIVLGAGSGGLASAFRAAHHGARVALLEPGALGGTCVNVGCVPKKAMWYAAQAAEDVQRARAFGFEVSSGALDWGHFVARREAYIARIHASYRKRLQEAGVALIAARGCLRAADRVEAAGETLCAPHVLIATGARPRRLATPGFELGGVSDDFFALRACPRSVAVIGGGYIGCELAGVLHALGAKVDLYARSTLLSHFDAELGEALTASMRAQGIGVHLHAALPDVRRDRDGLHLEHVATGDAAPYEQVLWALGRVPNSDDIGLGTVPLALDEDGHIVTDAKQDTNVPGVHAVGDVTGRTELTPVAIAAGRRLSDRLFGGQPDAQLDYANIPSVVFAHPPLGAVGLTEAQARVLHGDAVRVHRARFTPMVSALSDHPQQSLMKLVCVGPDERVVGVHLFGVGSDEMLQGFAVALKMGARKADLDATVAIHPTSAEELVLLGD